MKKIQIIPNSIIKLLGISCCSWMAWASIDAQAIEQKISSGSNMVHVFESMNKSSDKGRFNIEFDSDFTDPHGGKDKVTTESKLIVQKNLIFNAGNKSIAFANPSGQQEILRIDMPKETNACIFSNVGLIEGDVNIVKGIFSVPVGAVKGVIQNNGQLTLIAQNGQYIEDNITGPGTIKIKGSGTVTLEKPIAGKITLDANKNKALSLRLTTENASKYLVASKEGDGFVFDQNFDGNYQGNISGDGALTKMGIGVLTLTGDNQDRHSLTRIFSGEIAIKKPENLGIHSPVFFEKGSLHFTDSLKMQNSFSGAVSFIVDEEKIAKILGEIKDNGKTPSSLDIKGGGTVFLTGSNSYTGDTTVSNAALQIQSANNLGGSKNLILNNATLEEAPGPNHLDLKCNIFLDQEGTIYTDTRTINILGDISSHTSESANLYKEGLGKLAIHADIKNTNLHIKQGFVHISPPIGTKEENIFTDVDDTQEIFQKIDELTAERGASASPMIFLSDVSIDSDADVTISRNLVHVDNLYGSGKLKLDAESGYLVVESGDFAGVISSRKDIDSTIVKTGPGKLLLQGDNSNLFGQILIKGGKLIADSFIGKDINVVVFKEGFFVGNGHVKGLANEGIVSLGNSIGTLKVEEEFIQDSTARLHIKVNVDEGSDLIQVGSKATLNGTLCIKPEPGIYHLGTNYTILEATEVLGNFQSVENTASDTLAFTVSYEPDKVKASVAKTMYQLPRDDRMSDTARGLSSLMQKAQIQEGTDAFAFIENFFSLNNQKDLEKAYFQMIPLQLGGMAYESYVGAQAVANSFTGVLRRNGRCMDSTSSIWVDSIGHFADQKHGYKLGNYKSYMGGVVIGGNHFVNENIVIGAGVGFSNSYLKWGKDAAQSHIASFYAGINGGWVGDLFYANASIITSMNTFKNARFLQFAQINQTIKSTHYGVGLISRVETGYNFAMAKNICLRPFVDIDLYTIFERPVNEEKSSPLYFHRGSHISHELHGKMAIEATGSFVCNSICFSPGVLLGYIVETPLRSADYKVSLNDTGKQMDVKGFKKSNINQGIALGANVIASHKAASVFLAYEFDFGKDRSFIHQASVGVDWNF